jgi:hypothetical protein
VTAVREALHLGSEGEQPLPVEAETA